MDRIPFHCPHCGHSAEVDAHWAGKRGKCPSCQEVVTLSAVSPPIAPTKIDIETEEEREERLAYEAQQKLRESQQAQAKAAEERRLEELSRSEKEVLISMEKHLKSIRDHVDATNHWQREHDAHLTKLADNIGCMYTVMVLWLILTVIGVLIANSQ